MKTVKQPFARKEALYQVLKLEPETMDRLVKITGWGRELTQQTLLQLIVDNRVTCRNGNGRRVYFAKDGSSRQRITPINHSMN